MQGLDALEQLIHAGLTYVKGDGRRAPRLAEAVPSLDNGLWNGSTARSWPNSSSRGMESPAESYANPDALMYGELIEPKIVKYAYDPRQAAQLLIDLGYSKPADGFLSIKRRI